METHENYPGWAGLLRGEGDDPLMIRVAWLAALWVVFAVALAVFIVIAL